VRHPRQEGHHHAQGHPAGQEDPWRACLSSRLLPAYLNQTAFFKATKNLNTEIYFTQCPCPALLSLLDVCQPFLWNKSSWR
jgi:hypothetical protein